MQNLSRIMILRYQRVTSPRSQKTRKVNPSESRNPLKSFSSRKNMAKLLGRVASEYIQLVYHASKAKAENCLFFNEIEWVCEPSLCKMPLDKYHTLLQRIDRIRSTISSDLDNVFATTLNKLIDGKGHENAKEPEKSSLILDLTECLRTYDMLGLWRDAEEVLRREVVRIFVRKVNLAPPAQQYLPRKASIDDLSRSFVRFPFPDCSSYASPPCQHTIFISNAMGATADAVYAIQSFLF